VYARVAEAKLREWVASETSGGVSSGTTTTTTGGKTKKSPRAGRG
jgi:hypothetical protein